MILQFIRNKKLEIKKAAIPTLFLAFVTMWLRLVYLGYSDYQGDETKAMYRPESGQNMYEFLMDQRKGPLQFFVTAAMESVTDGYTNEFLLRLPFALAGALSVLVFYKFVKLNFGKDIAYVAAFLFSVNGFFVAFSRIVQYQSFTILFFLLALYLFSLAVENTKWKFSGWYLGAAFWGLSALAHYDAVFILPFVVYLYVKWFKKYSEVNIKDKVLVTVYAALITVLIMSTFYVPFILQISNGQIDYWVGRVEDATGKISSSIYTFNIYNPTFVMEVYLAFITLALFKVKRLIPLLLWAVFPMLFMEMFIDVPGTHIYTYVIPGIIAASLGFGVLKNLASSIKPRIYPLFLPLILLFLFMLSYAAFVDHRVEYPWVNKRFLIWSLNRPDSNYHLSIFGFPYYRHWEEIAGYIRENSTTGVFGTNERKTIPRYYLEEFSKEGENSEHYIMIFDPQSFTEQIYQSKPYYWIRILKKPADFVLKNGENDVVKIYKMPLGDLKHLELLHSQMVI